MTWPLVNQSVALVGQWHAHSNWIVKASRTEMGQTTNLLITDTYTLALSHFPAPSLSMGWCKWRDLGYVPTANHTLLHRITAVQYWLIERERERERERRKWVKVSEKRQKVNMTWLILLWAIDTKYAGWKNSPLRNIQVQRYIYKWTVFK